MTFAVCPAQGLPRVWRFDLTEPGILARLDKSKNLMRINKDIFDQLDRLQQWEVMRSSALVIEVETTRIL